MTDERNDLLDRHISHGLRELDGRDTPPDVTDRVLNGGSSRLNQGNPSRNLAAILVVGLGLATAIGVWITKDDGDPGPAPAVEQDARPKLPPPVSVRSSEDIAKLPRSTQHVHAIDLAPKDIQALQRISKLRGLTIRGHLNSEHLAALPRLDKLEQIVFEYELDKKHRQGLTNLTKLPRLTSIALAMSSVDDGILQTLSGVKKLRSLALQGELICTPKGMAKFAKALPRLRAFGIVTLRDIAGVVPPPLTPKGVWSELPASLTELQLNYQAIVSKTLERLPRLKKLDLFATQGPGKDLLKIAHLWRGATIVTPTGHHLAVDRRGKVHSKVRSVVLTQRKDNGAYGAAAYSFRHGSSQVLNHNNYVDLLLNGCGNFHINTHGDSANRVLDLGVVKKTPAAADLPQEGWLKDSFRPTPNHRYVIEVGRTGREANAGKLLVAMHITKIEGNQISIDWSLLEPEQAWAMAAPGPVGRAGTMGQCGGAHRAR